MVSENLSNLKEITPGVYFRAGDMTRGQCNGGFIVCDDYVMAIDAPTPEGVAEMFGEAKEISDKPLRFVILTHSHWDHDGGIDAFAEKGVTVLCNEKIRQKYIEDGKSGSYVGVSDRLTLSNNGRTIELFTCGTVHSATDMFILLPKEGVIFTGDSVPNKNAPWMGQCDIQNWIDTLEALDKLEVETVCVGHGPLAGHEVFGELAGYFTALRDEVGFQVSMGRTLGTTLEQVDIPSRSKWLVKKGAFRDHITSVYKQLTAQPPELEPSLMPRALVLIGDNYHPPAYIPPSLKPVFEEIGMPAQFIYDVTKLNAQSLKGIRLLVILRDGMTWPEPGGDQAFWLTEEQEEAIDEFISNGGGFLGKPYEPNAVIKNDVEFILMQRKPGGYRSPDFLERVFSVIPDSLHKLWFRQIWTDVPGASTRNHPAPFPIELATRLIRMFSFVGDTVLDPFLGSGTTSLAAWQSGRNSVGVEIDEAYLQSAARRFRKHTNTLTRCHELDVIQKV